MGYIDDLKNKRLAEFNQQLKEIREQESENYIFEEDF